MDLPEEFIEWAENNGVNLEAKEDYEAWLDCWENGFEAGAKQEAAMHKYE